MKEKILIVRLEKYTFKNTKNEDIEMCRVEYLMPLEKSENVIGNVVMQCNLKGSNFEKLKKYVCQPSVEASFSKKYNSKGYDIKIKQIGIDLLD